MLRTWQLAVGLVLLVRLAVPMAAAANTVNNPAQPLATPGEPNGCIQIFHDLKDAAGEPSQYNAIFLANLLGHWPQYDVHIRLIENYRKNDVDRCHATFYVGTNIGTIVPAAFLADFFKPGQHALWMGRGMEQLDPAQMTATFGHVVGGRLSLTASDAGKISFFDKVVYKDSVFARPVPAKLPDADTLPLYDIAEFRPVGPLAVKHVIATALNSAEDKSSPYMLRGDNKFLVGDIPFYFMNAKDRYMAFADVLFDVLDEPALHPRHQAITRIEDVHNFFEMPLLATGLATLQDEQVPVNIALIPLFVDPFNSYGQGQKITPVPVTQDAALDAVLREIAKNPRNSIIWHGVTHQHGNYKNPNSAVSGEDYEFWDSPKNTPFPQDDAAFWLDYLRPGLPIMQTYPSGTRYWLTPDYAGSSNFNRIIGQLFPWSIGRSRYYASSFKTEFTLRAMSYDARTNQATPDMAMIDQLSGQPWEGMDQKSKIGVEQLFPYEIFRDVYGQGIVPDTLGYIEIPTKGTGDSNDDSQPNSVDAMLADAKRNLVIRDFWAGFFFHPFVFAGRQRGGIGSYYGDTSELQKLIKGLKSLGYVFPSMKEFEALGAQRASLAGSDTTTPDAPTGQ